jgi:hypothetical protein
MRNAHTTVTRRIFSQCARRRYLKYLRLRGSGLLGNRARFLRGTTQYEQIEKCYSYDPYAHILIRPFTPTRIATQPCGGRLDKSSQDLALCILSGNFLGNSEPVLILDSCCPSARRHWQLLRQAQWRALGGARLQLSADQSTAFHQRFIRRN